MNNNPDCTRDPADCRVTVATSIKQPLIEWTPLFDGNGQQVNADPNTHVRHYRCDTCGDEWEAEMTGSEEPVITVRKHGTET